MMYMLICVDFLYKNEINLKKEIYIEEYDEVKGPFLARVLQYFYSGSL